MNIYLGLIHHPIINKRGEMVTTSVTNLDIHDIARSCKTFNIKKYFIVTPLRAQHELVQRILGHWEQDHAAAYNPDRQDALSIAVLKNSIEDSIIEIEKIEGKRPLVAVTGANFDSYDGVASHLRDKMVLDNVPLFLLFGTGWGLHASVIDNADYKLIPIKGSGLSGYNHLSVRSAVAIYLWQLTDGDASES